MGDRDDKKQPRKRKRRRKRRRRRRKSGPKPPAIAAPGGAGDDVIEVGRGEFAVTTGDRPSSTDSRPRRRRGSSTRET